MVALVCDGRAPAPKCNNLQQVVSCPAGGAAARKPASGQPLWLRPKLISSRSPFGGALFLLPARWRRRRSCVNLAGAQLNPMNELNPIGRPRSLALKSNSPTSFNRSLCDGEEKGAAAAVVVAEPAGLA
jgi:hypothetical protein